MAQGNNTLAKVSKAKEERDVQRVIRLILDSPVSESGPVAEIDGKNPLSSFSGKSMDVKTTLIMGVTLEALATRDLKLIEFLFKYGGMEPVKEQKVAIDMPTIIDDIDFTMTDDSDESTALPEPNPVEDVPVIDTYLGE